MVAYVDFEKRDRIGFVSLNRLDAKNAINEQLNAELALLWDAIADDDDVDVVVLRSAGKDFSAGADLKTFIRSWEHASFGDLRRYAREGLGGGLTRGRHRFPKPVIGAIGGYAVGAGFELALACDIRVAAESAKFGVFEVGIGLHQGDGGLVRLVNIAGVGVAMDLTLTGRPVDADEALRLGLVSQVVPDDELLAAATDTARQIANNAQSAVRSAKETVLELIGRPLDDALRLESLYGYSSFGEFSEVDRRIQARLGAGQQG